MTEATRRQLLDAGRSHFARHGLEGARVDRIAEDAGVNKAHIIDGRIPHSLLLEIGPILAGLIFP